MYELIPVGAQSYYINAPAKIGVWVSAPGEVCLIDSGSDKDAGRKVRQVLEKQHWKLRAILNTHSNADHIGGNRYLQSQTGCRIFSGGIEAAFTRDPLLEPSFLYGGWPCRDLRHKFLLAQSSEVTDFSDSAFPKEVEILPLPGHFFDQVGFRTPDGTVFLADCLSSQQTLEKYGVPFLYDVSSYLSTLENVCAMQAPIFVPSHADPTADIVPLAQYNREHVLAVGEQVLQACREPVCFEDILQKIFRHYGLTMNFEQYVLVGSTIRSFLAWHRDAGRVDIRFDDCKLLWQAI